MKEKIIDLKNNNSIIPEENNDEKENEKIMANFENIIRNNNTINIFHIDNKTKKSFVKIIISNYYNNIEVLEKNVNKNNYNNYYYEYYDEDYDYEENQYFYQRTNKIYITKNLIDDFDNEFKLTTKSNHFIGCYYLNNANLMLKEIIKIMPEIYYYKTKSFLKQINFKELKEHMKKNKEIIYDNVRNILQSFIYEAELNNKIINQLFYPLFYLNGFYDLANLFNNKLSTSDEIKINLSLNNINANFEKVYIHELMSIDNNIFYFII